MPAARVPDHRSASAACPNPAVYAAGIVRTRNGCRGCSCRGSNDGTRQFVRAVRAVEGDVTLRLERSQARLIGLACGVVDCEQRLKKAQARRAVTVRFDFSVKEISVAAMQAPAAIVPDGNARVAARVTSQRSEEHTSELQSLMRISYAVFCLKKKKNTTHT